MSSVVFPGSFDPATRGHLDIIERASSSFSKVYVLVAINPDKQTLFSLEERFEILCCIVHPFKNVEIVIWKDLIVDFMVKKNIKLLLRGVRGFEDFENEFMMHLINKSLSSQIDTIWFPASSRYLEVSSSVVKFLIGKKKDLSSFLPSVVEKAVKFKLQKGSLKGFCLDKSDRIR